MKTALSVSLAALIVAGVWGSQLALGQQVGKRTDLQRHDLSAPGREVIQALVELGPGEMAPRHSHPGEEIIYIVEGVWEYQIDGQPPVTRMAGVVLFIPAGAVHAARNVGTGRAVELATYIVERGKPLLEVAR